MPFRSLIYLIVSSLFIFTAACDGNKVTQPQPSEDIQKEDEKHSTELEGPGGGAMR